MVDILTTQGNQKDSEPSPSYREKQSIKWSLVRNQTSPQNSFKCFLVSVFPSEFIINQLDEAHLNFFSKLGTFVEATRKSSKKKKIIIKKMSFSSIYEDLLSSSIDTIVINNEASIESLLESSSKARKRKVRITRSLQNVNKTKQTKGNPRCKSQTIRGSSETLKKPLPYKPRRPPTDEKQPSIESIPSSDEETDQMETIPSISSEEKVSSKLEMMKDKLQTHFRFMLNSSMAT